MRAFRLLTYRIFCLAVVSPLNIMGLILSEIGHGIADIAEATQLTAHEAFVPAPEEPRAQDDPPRVPPQQQ